MAQILRVHNGKMVEIKIAQQNEVVWNITDALLNHYSAEYILEKLLNIFPNEDKVMWMKDLAKDLGVAIDQRTGEEIQ